MNRVPLQFEKVALNVTAVSHRHTDEHDAVAIHDVDGCMKAWGWRATIAGSLFGFILGAIFVANPFTAAELTFGIAGTLIVCSIECALVAGRFAACTAALHGQGILRGSKTGLDRKLVSGPLRKESVPPFESHSAE